VWWVSTRWNASRQVRPGQRAQALDILGDEHLVGIQVHDQSPVAASNDALRAAAKSPSHA
jgi:hypothetical protein